MFFPEAFFSARPAETATSLFFQVNGLNRFSMTTFANAYNFASRLWVDAVVDPVETRQWLALGLALAAASPKEATHFGVFRL